MRKAIAGLFITLGVLVPIAASAKSKPPKDTTPPSLTSIHIESSNASSSTAKAGDVVTITLTANEKVIPVVLVESKSLFARALNTSGNTWAASYTVSSKDPLGTVDYLIVLSDTAGNIMICSSARLPFIKYCPTTDGSSVTIYKDTTPPPPTDTVPPTIEAHADVFATTSETSIEVEYALPLANDDISGSVAVACSPLSGSVFGLGTTTVTCSAQDAAGNTATSSFHVVVTQEIPPPPPEPTPYTMAGQTDDSYLCGVTNDSWRFCDDAGTFGFTDDFGPTRTIDLGIGSNMGTGTIETLTIAGQMETFHPWQITITCRVDASANSAACADWPTITDDANETDDGKYWTADFSALNLTFNQSEYYALIIDDTGWEQPAYGKESPAEPYWLLMGLR